jgi:hypothetical protein
VDCLTRNTQHSAVSISIQKQEWRKSMGKILLFVVSLECFVLSNTLFITAQSPSLHPVSTPSKSATVPIQVENNQVFVELAFTRADGSDRKALCVISPPPATGWAVTETLARDLGLDLSGERGAEGGLQFVSIAKPPQVRVGGMAIDANDLPPMFAVQAEEFAPSTKAECFWNLLHLRRYQAAIDCTAKTLTLAQHGVTPPKDARLGTCASKASEWVYFDSRHHLQYKADEHGNRIMDFSYAGYGGGGVSLPDISVAATLSAAPGDNTTQIQDAIDKVSRRPLDAKGFRGAVLLKPGTYDVGGTLRITASGVVLRGSGSEDGGTILRMTGSPHRLLRMEGRIASAEQKAADDGGRFRKGLPPGSTPTWQTEGNAATITDAYVPAGADSFQVSNAAGFHTGDSVLIRRPVTQQWIHLMAMDTLVRDGKAQTWIAPGAYIQTDRTIRQIKSNRITLDVPLTEPLDAEYLKPEGATMIRYTFPARISQVGVEHLRVVAPSRDAPISETQYTLLLIAGVIDGWARDVAVEETTNAIGVEATAKRITLDSIRVLHKTAHSGGAAPADFSISGTQVFVNRCSVSGDGTWPLVTQARVTGPIAVLNFVTDERGVAPHQRWATGLLVDSSTFSNSTHDRPGIAFSNRGTAGSGHGWDVGWAVAWNVTTPYLLVQRPPGAMNWCVGCTGQPVPPTGGASGTFDAAGTQVTPSSLYLEQLRERLGDAALANIGYP